MNDDNLDKRFNAYLNKLIIFQSKKFYKKEVRRQDNEKLIIDDENFSTYLDGLSANGSTRPIEEIMDVKIAYKELSDIEQKVLYLLYKRKLKTKDASIILKICSKSVSRIHKRAFNKIKKYINGGLFYER